jgi:hypothetical protein
MCSVSTFCLLVCMFVCMYLPIYKCMRMYRQNLAPVYRHILRAAQALKSLIYKHQTYGMHISTKCIHISTKPIHINAKPEHINTKPILVNAEDKHIITKPCSCLPQCLVSCLGSQEPSNRRAIVLPYRDWIAALRTPPQTQNLFVYVYVYMYMCLCACASWIKALLICVYVCMCVQVRAKK